MIRLDGLGSTRLLSYTCAGVELSFSRPAGPIFIITPEVSRAIAYCEAHFADPISVHDVAAAAHASVRKLQEDFRICMATTPLAYLKSLRLHRAHQSLVAIARGRGTGTVTEVAIQCGFSHLSRFAASYKDIYGYSPSETLRNGFSANLGARQ